MRFEVLYAYVYSLDHVKELRLEDQRVAWMIEHAGSVLELLEVSEPLAYGVGDTEQMVLR